MRFLWPEALLAYLLVPALIAVYMRALRSRARASLRYPTLEIAALAAAAGRPWRRHLPAAAYVLTTCGLIFAMARPVWPIPVPDNRAAVMLSIDVSGSMIETDVWPNRMEAAKKTATAFIRELPAGTKVGLVKFSTRATLITPPTGDHDRVVAALEALHPEGSTAIGDGLLEAVYALPGRARPADGNGAANGAVPPAGAAVLQPAAVVLLSDGGNNAGTAPDQAALIAHRLRVTVYTVGLGRPAPDLETAGKDLLDEETLKRIAAFTDGTYQRASTAMELTKAYARLGRTVAWRRRPEEIGGIVSGASAAMLGGTLVLGMRWRRLD